MLGPGSSLNSDNRALEEGEYKLTLHLVYLAPPSEGTELPFLESSAFRELC